MRILVVIFALLGMAGTGFFGAVMQTVFDESANGGNGKQSAKEVIAEIDNAIAQAKATPIPDQEAAIAGLEAGKSAIGRATNLPTVYFGAAGLGFLFMLLAVFKVGPKPLSAVGLLGAGVAPLGYTMSIFSAIGKLFEFMKTLDPNVPPILPPEDLQTAQLVIVAFGAGFVLSGLCAFFVKRDA